MIGSRTYLRPESEPASELEEPLTEFEGFAAELEEPAGGLEESGAGAPGTPGRYRSYFLRDRKWWYIWHETRGVDQLYDAERDPRAEHDLAAERPDIVGRLREQIRAWEAETRRFLVPGRRRLRKQRL